MHNQEIRVHQLDCYSMTLADTVFIHQRLQVLQGRITTSNHAVVLQRLTEGEPGDHLQVFWRNLGGDNGLSCNLL
jgi:hypothetical protein